MILVGRAREVGGQEGSAGDVCNGMPGLQMINASTDEGGLRFHDYRLCYSFILPLHLCGTVVTHLENKRDLKILCPPDLLHSAK